MKRIKPPLPSSTFLETVFQTEEDDDILHEKLPTQQYFDESMLQLADMMRDDNLVIKDYLEQFHELRRLYIKEGVRDPDHQFDHRFVLS